MGEFGILFEECPQRVSGRIEEVVIVAIGEVCREGIAENGL